MFLLFIIYKMKICKQTKIIWHLNTLKIFIFHSDDLYKSMEIDYLDLSLEEGPQFIVYRLKFFLQSDSCRPIHY